jgi:hypothetical protein
MELSYLYCLPSGYLGQLGYPRTFLTGLREMLMMCDDDCDFYLPIPTPYTYQVSNCLTLRYKARVYGVLPVYSRP